MFEFTKFDDSLISADEVKRYSPSKESSEVKFTCNFIIMKEEKLFNLCLGWEFYCKLMLDKVSYSVCEDFKENESYPVGKQILFNSIVFIAKKQTSGQKPNDEEYWGKAPKFNKEEYNYLWDRYLKFILAWNILHTSVLYSAIRHTGMGLSRLHDEGRSKAATIDEIQAFKSEARGDIRDLLRNMELHIFRYPDKYPNYGPLLEQQSCDDESGCIQKKKKHYGFNTKGSKYA